MNVNRFRNASTLELSQENSIWLRYIVRPLSFYVAYVFQRLGFTANGVSYLSILVAFAAFLFFLLGNRVFVIVGAVLVHMWMLLDCVDGNLARVSEIKNPYGEFVDSMSGYTLLGFVFLGLGMVAETEVSWLNRYVGENYFLLLGSIASVSTLTTRLIFQKFVATGYEIRLSTNPGSIRPRGLLNFLEKNVGISGLFMPAMLLAVLFSYVQAIVVFYAAYYFAILIICYLRLIFAMKRVG